ncbi:MAG: four helix bundle protein [Planctomycetaceae bacterium]|nr:four helix bundle protein [Planctomycetaceae bacterium]
MKYKRFEELPVWDSARELAIRIFGLTATGVLKNYSGLRDQLERAGLSVSNNIAEGFDRGTNAELLTFLYIARLLGGNTLDAPNSESPDQPEDPRIRNLESWNLES